jgi:DNA topoisomerase-1
MPKKIKTTTTLIIVESPAKCKTIETYLGAGYKCIATYGHLRTISSLKHIDIQDNFNTTYTLIEEALKRKQYELIKKEIKKADDVILASDLDREGEMISWSVMELFHLPLTTKRIVFKEITETAIRNAINNPRTIDMNLIHAQKSRHILDVLMGFKISPTLWKFIAYPKKETALSAGRCQTPALKLIYENQQEIDKSHGKSVYNVVGYITNMNLPFQLKNQLENEDSMVQFLKESIHFSHIYTCSLPTKIYKPPPEPLTTSRLQQLASNKLHNSPKDTMKICQKLYEEGYITYMRTDSSTYSDEFKEMAANYITMHYSADYVNQDMTVSHKKHVQEAHEAIRPTNLSLKELPEDKETKCKTMYKLIWTTTLESCMKAASYMSITATVSAPFSNKYVYSSEMVDFPGWKRMEDKFAKDSNEYAYLQMMQKEIPIQVKKTISSITMVEQKLHYTEAKLVNLLEEKGIGRPSTFASLVDKIQDREYVKKMDIKGKEIECKDFEMENGEIIEVIHKRTFGNEKGKLVITPLGTIVIEFLLEHFGGLFEYDYTSCMENELDFIANGEKDWVSLCSKCNGEIDELILNITDKSKYKIQIDESNSYIIGNHGPVIKCVENGKTSFKSVKLDIDIDKLQNGEYTVEDVVVENERMLYVGDNYGNAIVKRGMHGTYVLCNGKKQSMKELDSIPLENIMVEDILRHMNQNEDTKMIREITKDMSIRKSVRGDYLFYKTSKMKKPKFYNIKECLHDYKECDVELLKSWIKSTYKIG